jgi:hypothetical protein
LVSRRSVPETAVVQQVAQIVDLARYAELAQAGR